MTNTQLKKLLIDLRKARQTIEQANEAIQFFGGHGDTEAMHSVFREMRTVIATNEDFVTRHGKSL